MLSTRIFLGFSQICTRRSSAIQAGIAQQRRCHSSNAQNMRNACKKIRDFMYPSSIPSHFLGVSTVTEQANASVTLFPDRELARVFRTRYKNSEDFGTLFESLNCPQSIINYLQVAHEMQSRGLIPLVHGQSAIWMIPQRILKALDFERCQLLRLPEEAFGESHEIAAMIDHEMQQRAGHWLPFYHRITFFKNLDLQPEFSARLLSATIGLFHCEAKNAPLSFVFGGSIPRGPASISCRYPGNRSLMSTERCKTIANRIIANGMIQRGFSCEVLEDLIKAIQPLYDAAEQAEIGQLIVLGVPQSNLHKFVYHCETGGIPTGIPIQRAVESISTGIIPREGCQVRFVFCRETMARSSGIEVVNLMDEESLQSFLGSSSCSFSGIDELMNALYPDVSPFQDGLNRIEAARDRQLQYAAIIGKLDRIIENLNVGN